MNRIQRIAAAAAVGAAVRAPTATVAYAEPYPWQQDRDSALSTRPPAARLGAKVRVRRLVDLFGARSRGALMVRTHRRLAGVLSAVVALLALSACGGVDLAQSAETSGLAQESVAPAAASEASGKRVVRVEVAETGSRFVPDEHFVDSAGVPTRGNFFITEGYVYRPGTLTCADGTCNGVLYDEQGNPSPEFPDRVLGTWTCYGTHTEDAGTLTSGAVVVTTQVFDLGKAVVGDHTVVSSGHELIDVGVPVQRAIVGGTGRYNDAGGTQTQTLLGLNNPDLVLDGIPLFGVSLSVQLQIR